MDKKGSEKNAEDKTEEVELNEATSAEGSSEEVVEEQEISIEEQLKIQLANKEDQYLRLFAEFDNYRKRNAKENIEIRKTASANVLRDLIPVLDDLERADANIEAAKDFEALKSGIDLIMDKMRNVLSQKGLVKMDVIGQQFDPELHEAISELPAEGKKGEILDVLEHGYTLNDKIIRYPKVIVGK